MEFLRTVPSDVLDFWCGYDTEYPLNQQDIQWEQFGHMLSMVWQCYATQLAAAGVEPVAIDIDKYLPKRMRSKKKTFENASEIERKLNARFG